MKKDHFLILSLIAFWIIGVALDWNPWTKALVILNSIWVLFRVGQRFKEICESYPQKLRPFPA